MIFVFIILGILGLVDSSYLVYEHFQPEPIVCNITDGCETVLTSKYSQILGIPTALFGVFYYLYIIVLSIYVLLKKKLYKLLGLSTILGLLASLWFLYLQIFVLNAYCLYCLLSVTSSIILFILGMILIIKTKNDKK